VSIKVVAFPPPRLLYGCCHTRPQPEAKQTRRKKSEEKKKIILLPPTFFPLQSTTTTTSEALHRFSEFYEIFLIMAVRAQFENSNEYVIPF
jgi:hypothetical protein